MWKEAEVRGRGAPANVSGVLWAFRCSGDVLSVTRLCKPETLSNVCQTVNKGI